MRFVEKLIFNFTLLLMPRYIIKKFPRLIHAETFLFVFQPLILFNGEPVVFFVTDRFKPNILWLFAGNAESRMSNLINLFRALTRQLPHSGGLIRDNLQP